MTDGPGSEIPFVRHGQRTAALAHASIAASSRGLGWPGVHVELGENVGWSVDELAVEGHYLSINLDDDPLIIETRGRRGFCSQVIGPDELWVQPAGDTFTFRVRQRSRWGAAVLEPTRLRAILGVDLQLRPGLGVRDPAIVALLQALLAEVRAGGPSGQLFVDGMVTALGAQLLRAYGSERPGYRGGLTRHTLARLTEFIDANLAASLRVDELAGLANLSPAHFARAFKTATGSTPHQFVVGRRLRAARRLLDLGHASLAEVARACGFSDQAHLTRSFRKAFGVTPGRYRSAR